LKIKEGGDNMNENSIIHDAFADLDESEYACDPSDHEIKFDEWFDIDPRSDSERYPPNMLGMALLLAELIKENHVFVEDMNKAYYYSTIRWRLDKSETHLTKIVMEFALF
jgi:hypothetical protein